MSIRYSYFVNNLKDIENKENPEWGIALSTVNAFYDPFRNQIS